MSLGFKTIALAAALAAVAGAARADDVKVALIRGQTGPLQAYAKQTETGFMMGLEYATKGTMTVDGRKIVVITKDDQSKPDIAKTALTEAYEDDGADIAVGTTSSAAALAMLPVAEEHKKILIVEPAVADDITGSKWNRYIFRTARNSSQDAISNAVAIGKPGVNIATLAPGLRLRSRRRRRLQGGARQDRREPRRRGIRAAEHDRLHRARPAPVRRAQGQAGQENHLDRLGRRRRSARQACRSRSWPLRHRTLDRRQHSAGAGRLQALPRPRGRGLLLLRHPQEPGERLARRRAREALSRAAGLLHRRRLRRRRGAGDGARQGEVDRHGEADLRPWRAWSSTRPRGR